MRTHTLSNAQGGSNVGNYSYLHPGALRWAKDSVWSPCFESCGHLCFLYCFLVSLIWECWKPQAQSSGLCSSSTFSSYWPHSVSEFKLPSTLWLPNVPSWLGPSTWIPHTYIQLPMWHLLRSKNKLLSPCPPPLHIVLPITVKGNY